MAADIYVVREAERLIAQGYQKARVSIYSTIGEMLVEQDFAKCDAIFEGLQTSSLPKREWLAFFIATVDVNRELLPHREYAFKRMILGLDETDTELVALAKRFE